MAFIEVQIKIVDSNVRYATNGQIQAKTTNYEEYHFIYGYNDGRIEIVLMSIFQVPEKDNYTSYYHLVGKYYKSETEYLYLNGNADGTIKNYISFKMYDVDDWEQVEKIPYNKWSTLVAFIILNRLSGGELQTDSGRKFYHGGLNDCNFAKILTPTINNADKRKEILEVTLRIIDSRSKESHCCTVDLWRGKLLGRYFYRRRIFSVTVLNAYR